MKESMQNRKHVANNFSLIELKVDIVIQNVGKWLDDSIFSQITWKQDEDTWVLQVVDSSYMMNCRRELRLGRWLRSRTVFHASVHITEALLASLEATGENEGKHLQGQSAEIVETPRSPTSLKYQ